jgi:citrate lyase synthetase
MDEGKTLEIKEIKRTDEDISATKVREALINNDIEAFKKLTDKKMHKMFEELKAIIS